MRVTVLGSAAGGGFPQWNCACSNCSRLRAGTIRARGRSQAQLLVSVGARPSYLINASPDLRTQILSTSSLNPSVGLRDTPIAGIILTSADVDSIAGLLHLREFQPLRIYSTPSIRRILLEDNGIFRVLARSVPPAEWQEVSLGAWFALDTSSDSEGKSALRCRLIPLCGAYPDYVSDSLRRTLAPEEAVTGAVLAQGNKQFFYAPAVSGKSAAWEDWFRSSDVSLVDGTFWQDDELISAGVGKKTAREIGHLPLSGPEGLLERCKYPTRGKRLLIHVNNTNPILDEESPEFREVTDAGWEVAYDGMEFDL